MLCFMQRNRSVTAALAGLLTIGAASAGYVIAQSGAVSGDHPASHQSEANGSAGPSPASPSPGSGATSAGAAPSVPAASPPAPTPSGAGDTFSDPSLAQFIGRQAGTGLAGRAPQAVPAAQVGALSRQVPAGAAVDTRTDTVTFTASTVSFTVVAIAPGAPDMTFTVAGLVDPVLSVPAGARVTVRFINNDTDEAHGWLVTRNRPPFTFGQPSSPAIAGAYAGIIGDPAAAADGANTVTFTAGPAGRYDYICPMPGHAQMGMHGSFIVR
jgi:rusticyanin